MGPRKQFTIYLWYQPFTNQTLRFWVQLRVNWKCSTTRIFGKPPSYFMRGLIWAVTHKYLGNHLSRSCSISPMVESLQARITRLPRFKRDSRTDLRKTKVSEKKICRRNSSISKEVEHILWRSLGWIIWYFTKLCRYKDGRQIFFWESVKGLTVLKVRMGPHSHREEGKERSDCVLHQLPIHRVTV